MDLLETLCERVDRGEAVAQAVVLHQDGSSPRTAGARMLVLADGSILGTVGGGRLEAEAIRLAGRCLATGDPISACFDLRAGGSPTAGASDQGVDMICGGRVELLVEPVAGEDSRAVLARACGLLRGRRPFTLVTALRPEGDGGRLCISRCVLEETEPGERGPGPTGPAGGIGLDEDGLRGLLAQARGDWVLVGRPEGRYLVERRRPPDTVYLFGAGHVAKAVAVVASFAGFRIAVLDDRSEFATPERFPMADLILVPDLSGGMDDPFGLPGLRGEPMGGQAYLVIVTRGHRHDAAVLDKALGTGAGYIGMIGSRTKREQTWRAMAARGWGEADLARVHCPVGLDIGAQTPEEIAVSIVAQLIQVRASSRNLNVMTAAQPEPKAAP